MKNFFKNWDTPSIFMVAICVLAIITLGASSNVIGAIWAFNTIIWVSIAKMNNDATTMWRDLYDEVSKELREYKNNETEEK